MAEEIIQNNIFKGVAITSKGIMGHLNDFIEEVYF